jgi:flagellar motor component MotA
MNLIIGILVVFGCVLGGFAVHGGFKDLETQLRKKA